MMDADKEDLYFSDYSQIDFIWAYNRLKNISNIFKIINNYKLNL